jgi:predicted transposase YbfD/YdcC
MRHKDEGERGEATVARKVIKQAGDLSNQTLSGDALHANRETAELILKQGGDYILQVKDNQPELHRVAKERLKDTPLFVQKV